MTHQPEQDERESGGHTSCQGVADAAELPPLPTALQPDRIARYRDAFYREYRPVGITESVIVHDLARRAAQMDLLEDVIGAVQRETARSLMAVRAPLVGEESTNEDAVLAAAVATGRLDECQRHSMGSVRAFLRDVKHLRELQAARRTGGGPSREAISATDNRFAAESACLAYLECRLQQADGPCARCGKRGGSWLPSRRCWECRACRFQQGLRVGTVMERSPLALTAWFAAIQVLLREPTMTTAALAERIGMRRLATVRSMAHRIRKAISADDPSARLAGLDRVFARTA